MNPALLTADEEKALARRVRAGDIDARNELVERNARLAHEIASRWYSPDPATEWTDLLQEAMLGLMDAADNFDPERGTRFSTFAFQRIRARVTRWVYTVGTIKRASNPHYRQVKKYAVRSNRIRRAAVARLDVPLPGFDDDGTTRLEAVTADEDTEAMATTNLLIEQYLDCLTTDRERDIARMYAAGHTYVEVGIAFGLSKERVRQILDKMKRARQKHEANDATKQALRDANYEQRPLTD